MMNSKRIGNAFEVEMVFRLKDVFPNCRTCRFIGQLRLDSRKIDLSGTDPYYFQCKATESTPAYHKILEEMPQTGQTNVIPHKSNNWGRVAVMRFEDFMNLIKK